MLEDGVVAEAALATRGDDVSGNPPLEQLDGEGVLAALGLKRNSYTFGHNARHEVGEDRVLFDSYHCSRYNTQTGRLTESMFHDVVHAVRRELYGG